MTSPKEIIARALERHFGFIRFKRGALNAAAANVLSALEAEGWVLMPAEATPEMVQAGIRAAFDAGIATDENWPQFIRNLYSAMRAAQLRTELTQEAQDMGMYDPPARPMTGILPTLTPEQREKAIAGDPVADMPLGEE